MSINHYKSIKITENIKRSQTEHFTLFCIPVKVIVSIHFNRTYRKSKFPNMCTAM